MLVLKCVALAFAHTWLTNSGGAHKADERDIGGTAGLQGDRVHPEVLQHVEDGLEPEVLHSTLTVLVQGQTEVLRGRERSQVKIRSSSLKPNIFLCQTYSQTHLGLALEVKGEDIFSAACLALANQEDAMARRASSQHQLSSFEAGQSAVKPLTLAEGVLHRLRRRHLREQEGPWTGEYKTNINALRR